MAGPLEKTVALVTGSSSGIGAATARRLAANGAAVALAPAVANGSTRSSRRSEATAAPSLYTRERDTTLRMKFASMWDGVAKSPHNATGRWSAHGAAASPSS
jgi:NAD(P)-dependent dehydrogenase (short-subunit alcohol dehydrogenase family)